MTKGENNPISKGGLPQNIQMEKFSLAYLHTLASANGYQIDIPTSDYQSVDATIKSGTLIQEASVLDPTLHIQLKSTSHDIGCKDYIPFQLPIKNYNDLRGNTKIPRILLLVCVPADPDAWVIHGDKTLLDATGYYLNLRGYQPSENKTNITIKIPKTNIFTKDTLHEFMRKIANGDQL
jgi:hypothetical protein